MIKQLWCKIRRGHEYVQFEKLVYRDGLPTIRYGKECKKCRKVRWMR